MSVTECLNAFMFTRTLSTPLKRPHVGGSGHIPSGKRWLQRHDKTDGAVRRPLSFLSPKVINCHNRENVSSIKIIIGCCSKVQQDLEKFQIVRFD